MSARSSILVWRAENRQEPGTDSFECLNTFETDEDGLAFDIAYALAQSKFKLKGKDQSIEACQFVAQDVIKQLKLSGWEFSKGPETPAH